MTSDLIWECFWAIFFLMLAYRIMKIMFDD